MNRLGGAWLGLFACVATIAAPTSCRDFKGTNHQNGGVSIGSSAAGAADSAMGGHGGRGSLLDEAGATSRVDAAAGAGGDPIPALGGTGGDEQRGGDETTLGAAGQAGAGGGTSTDDGPLAPSAFDQLALWLEASPNNVSRDENQRVLTWTDRSPNANDAVGRPPYQAPMFVEADAIGHAALRFAPVLATGNVQDPSALQVPDSLSIRFGSGDFAYLVVMQWSNDPKPDQPRYSGTGVILGKQSLASGFPGILLMANYPAFFADVLSATRLSVQLKLGGAFAVSFRDGLNDSRFRVYMLRRTAAGIGLRINRTDEGGTALAADFDMSATGEPLTIGGTPAQPLKGDIAEIIGLKGTTSDADIARLVEHLMQKYELE